MSGNESSRSRKVVSGVVLATVITGAAIAVPVLAVEIHDASSSTAAATSSSSSVPGSSVSAGTSSAPDAVSRGS